MSDLHFQQAYKPEGISTLAMSQYDGSPEPVVRELLQNSLDAADDAGRATSDDPAEVVFRICDVPWKDIPGLDSYKNAFKAVLRAYEREQTRSPDAAAVLDRIGRTLKQPTVRCLMCRDNGIGLDEDRLRRILADAHTNKASGGGSFGVGHLTAFSASNLRYVLYLGHSRNGVNRETLLSGHAVLASHQDGDGKQRTADGYLLQQQGTLFDSFFDSDPTPLLRGQLKLVDDTGSVVCIVGFNSFRDDTRHVVGAINRVAATNFLSALYRRRMVITIHDEITATTDVIDHQNLGKHLRDVSGQRRVRGSGRGWIAGAQAYRAWETLKHGEYLPTEGLNAGELRIAFRKIDPGERTRVNLFRNGMWITRDAPYLQASDFVGNQSFDAVVSLVRGKLYDLVRAAEGPEHRSIQLTRMERNMRADLESRLAEVADLLRAQAGEVEDVEEFTPENFAIFSGTQLREADPMPPYRIRPSRGDERVVTPQPGPDRPKKPDGPSTRRTPKPGRGVRLRSSIVPPQSGPLNRLHVRWQILDATRTSDVLGVRVLSASGSDETCEQPLPPDWLKIEAAVLPNGRRIAARSEGLEVTVPTDLDEFTILLSESMLDTSSVELDVVRRRTKDEATGGQ